MNKEISEEIKRRGLLLEKEIYELIESFSDGNSAKLFLEQIQKISGQKIITKSTLIKNASFVHSFVESLLGEDKNLVEKIFINFGISLEVRREKHLEEKKREGDPTNKIYYKVFYSNTTPDKKLDVGDFTNYFRARYQELQRILMQRAELQKNLVSIGKISTERTNLSVIGIIKEKRVTKNKNIIITLEDPTGEIGALVKFDNEKAFQKAEELFPDDVIGIKASGNRDLLFVYEIIFPDSMIREKIKFENEVCVAFLSDVHCGSDRHLKKSFQSFLNWINSDDTVAKKIKYIFFMGDNVDGVGIFPRQEEFLELKSMREQYDVLASYLKKIPEDKTIFMCPGQHDATRVAEPQPLISRRYAPALYEIENLVLVTNPALIELCERDKGFKVLMYHGASIHVFINEIKNLRLMKAHRCPAKAVCEMLKRRHLAPMYGVSPSVVYIPNGEKDPLVISQVPDVLCTGEVHRLDIENYNGVLIITGSCWQAQTAFEEKVGNIPDPGKVPVLNLKTRELKIFDFSEKEEVEYEY